ncbi:spore germination protein [Halobacillus halophilus DSM 2266]|uniref:Spore germination protein n=1 Tax=Halobacillus halophilus (strain ATCC 35676 / DSM 2266 / JCM 20832 / KCTC 3685 / LMG 17431 / NBRC 102448 / NCIMB 2269) TaxID=866895 RepID=I0JI32_HALH3|nr:Ger(x)C family spore germination protein [Halobacillus halophilus]CCG43800.1 spore germination protein [Halobacillus halophilus DSM 2266]
MYRKWIWVLLSLTLLTGCWDSKSIEQTIYISSLGIDYKDGEFHIYSKILQFENVGKQEGGGGPPEELPIWGAQGVGKTFDSATDKLYKTTQQPISWAHIGDLIITTRALEKDGVLDEVMDVLNRYSETRSEVMLYATDDELPLLAQGTPILGKSPWYSRVNNPYPVFKQFSLITPITLRNYLIDQKEPGKVVKIPKLGINENKWTKDNEPHPIHEFGGSAFVYRGKYKGSLSTEEEQGVRWMQKEAKRIPLYLYKNEEDYASVVFADPKIDIEPEVQGEEVTVSVKVEVTGEIIENPFHKDDQKLVKEAEQQIEEQIKSTYQEALEKNIDVYQFTNHVYKKDPKAFKKLGLENKDWITSETLKDLKVKVSIASSGKLKLKE